VGQGYGPELSRGAARPGSGCRADAINERLHAGIVMSHLVPMWTSTVTKVSLVAGWCNNPRVPADVFERYPERVSTTPGFRVPGAAVKFIVETLGPSPYSPSP